MGWQQQMKEKISKRKFSLGTIRRQLVSAQAYLKSQDLDAETQQNSYAKPQCPHWEEHQCGLGFSPKSSFAMLEAAVITSYMYKGSEGKSLSVNVSCLGLLSRTHFDCTRTHTSDPTPIKFKYIPKTWASPCNF